MKIQAALSAFVALVAFPQQTDGLGAQWFCDRATRLLPTNQTLSCDCGLDWSLRSGLAIAADCTPDNSQCIAQFGGIDLCGKPTVGATLAIRRNVESRLNWKFDTVTITDPINQDINLGSFELTIQHVGVRNLDFDKCTAALGGKECTCTVCDDKESIKFDCSMNTFGSTPIPGPNIPTCLGVSTFGGGGGGGTSRRLLRA